LIEGADWQPAITLRMYASHISGLPLALLGLIAAHFYLIHVFNLAPTAWGPDSSRPEIVQEPMGRFSDHGFAILRNSAVYYGAALVLAALFPAALGESASGPMTGVKPPWPYYWIYGLENLYGVKGIIVGQTLLAVLLVALPFIDRAADRRPAARKLPLGIVGAAFGVMLALHLYAWIAPPQVHEGLHGHDDHGAPSGHPPSEGAPPSGAAEPAPHAHPDESAPVPGGAAPMTGQDTAPAPDHAHPADDHAAPTEPHDDKSTPRKH
jgi:quinol-cytochrome oxidoreductase complex cytochrome b subunit